MAGMDNCCGCGGLRKVSLVWEHHGFPRFETLECSGTHYDTGQLSATRYLKKEVEISWAEINTNWVAIALSEEPPRDGIRYVVTSDEGSVSATVSINATTGMVSCSAIGTIERVLNVKKYRWYVDPPEGIPYDWVLDEEWSAPWDCPSWGILAKTRAGYENDPPVIDDPINETSQYKSTLKSCSATWGSTSLTLELGYWLGLKSPIGFPILYLASGGMGDAPGTPIEVTETCEVTMTSLNTFNADDARSVLDTATETDHEIIFGDEEGAFYLITPKSLDVYPYLHYTYRPYSHSEWTVAGWTKWSWMSIFSAITTWGSPSSIAPVASFSSNRETPDAFDESETESVTETNLLTQWRGWYYKDRPGYYVCRCPNCSPIERTDITRFCQCCSTNVDDVYCRRPIPLAQVPLYEHEDIRTAPDGVRYHGLVATIDFQREKASSYGGPVLLYANDLWVNATGTWKKYDRYSHRGDIECSGAGVAAPETGDTNPASTVLPDQESNGLSLFYAVWPTLSGYEVGGQIGAVVTGLNEDMETLYDHYPYGRAPNLDEV